MRDSSEYENDHKNRRLRFKMRNCNYALGFFLIIHSVALFASSDEDTIPTTKIGAEIFIKRCALCHGSQGMGEGQIPLKIKDYPDTNIASAQKATTKEEIHDVIVYGGILDNISQYMPPMGNELTWTELNSVSLFVQQLRESPKQAIELLSAASSKHLPKSNLGREVYQARCVLCHGKYGLGDGRMARVIKSPPPFNLTLSRAPKSYLSSIIVNGGEPIGRSPQMPPWGDQLSNEEVDSVVDYIISLRK